MLARLWPLLVISGAFVAAAMAAWGRVGEVIVDTGRELDVPRRLLAGEQLYRDVRWYYGPLAPWTNAELYRWFGVHMDVLAGAGLASAALLTLVVYLLSRRFAGRMASTGAALGFISLGAFSNVSEFAIFNFVLPYTYAATYGMLAAATSLLFLVRHAQDDRARDFVASAAFLALAALSKIEPLAPALVAHALFALGIVWTGRARPWPHVAGWAGAAAIVVACYGLLGARSGGAVWRDLGALANPASARFIAETMGIQNPWRSALRVGASLAVFTGVVLGAAIAARLAARALPALVRRSLPAAAGLAAFGAYRAYGVGDALRALPVIMVAMLGALAIRWMRSPASRAETLPRLLLWSFGLTALGRILLHVNLDVYGFYLLPVGLVCLSTVVSDDVPRALECDASGRRAFALAGLGLLLGTGADAVRGSLRQLGDRTVDVVTARGTIRVPEYQRGVAEMVAALSELPPRTRLLAIPEGAGVNFFAGLEPAGPFSSHLPMEIPDDAADGALRDSLRATPPDYVLWISRDMREFGYGGFGVDYALRTAAWVRQEYRPALATHSGVVLLQLAPEGHGSEGRRDGRTHAGGSPPLLDPTR